MTAFTILLGSDEANKAKLRHLDDQVESLRAQLELVDLVEQRCLTKRNDKVEVDVKKLLALPDAVVLCGQVLGVNGLDNITENYTEKRDAVGEKLIHLFAILQSAGYKIKDPRRTQPATRSHSAGAGYKVKVPAPAGPPPTSTTVCTNDGRSTS